ncbi:MAG: alkaline phosphatase family protein [Turneriella sp.]|nr:alkaline phosphatase family protein [Turneriella sp.]
MRFLFAANLTAAVLLLTAFAGCKKNDTAWIERYKRSVRNDVDLYLVPERYAVLESSWLKKSAVSRFDKEELIKTLAVYGRSLEDLKKNPVYEYKEEGNEVRLKVGRISHSTAYDYDTAIPLVFHGKWFAAQQSDAVAYQQHIAPTLAKVLGVRKPGGVEIEALPILKDLKGKPEIILVAVIDQGGMGLLQAHKAVTPRIAALMAKSVNFTNAQVGHLDAHTAVGHMAIGTGAFPRKSSVIGNTFFTMEKSAGKQILRKDEIYAVRDETKVTTEELKSETLGDVLNQVNAGKSVVVAQSYALRAAIGMGGHGSLGLKEYAKAVTGNNLIYWLDAANSKWVTDTRYYSLPHVAAASDVMLSYTKNYPAGFEGYTIRDTRAAFENWGVMMSTPAETQLEGELVRAVIREEIIQKKKHNDGFTDLVYVSFKSADAVGHHFGYHSLEARDTLAAIDKEIGALEDFLTREYGDRFVLVLTADHGCAPLSEITGGARLTVEEVIAAIDTLLPPEVAANESLVHFMTVGQVSLNHDLMNKHRISIEAIRDKIMAMKPENRSFFRNILTRKDLGLDG